MCLLGRGAAGNECGFADEEQAKKARDAGALRGPPLSTRLGEFAPSLSTAIRATGSDTATTLSDRVQANNRHSIVASCLHSWMMLFIG